MSEQHTDSLIDDSLKQLLGQIRKTQWLRGMLMLGTFALGGLLLIMAVDWFFAPLPGWARWAMFVAWIIVLVVIAKKGFAAVLRPISLVQLARWVEFRHPEMQERISTALELRGQREGVSEQLFDELRRAALLDAGKVDARLEVKSVSTNARWWRPVVGMLAVLALLLLIWPSQSVRLLVRAVAPFSQLGNAGAASFVIKPGTVEMLAGDPLTITVEYQGDHDGVEIVTKWDDGQTTSEATTGAGPAHVYAIDSLTRSFRYHARSGRAESDTFAVTVWPLPQLVDTKIAIDPPKYLGLTRSQETLNDQVSAVVGSQFVITARTNTAVESARLVVEGKTIATAKVSAVTGVSELEFTWSMESPGLSEAIIFLTHRLGKEREAHRFTIEMVDDLAPKILLLNPIKKELWLRSDEVLDLRYEVTEDFSLIRVAVELNDFQEKTITLGQNLPFRIDGSKPPRYRGNVPLSIGDLTTRLANKTDFQIRVTAQDGKPAERKGPGIGYSEWIHIHVAEQAESLVRQELREQHEGAMQQMDKNIHEIREARERMDRHREEIKKAEISENAEKELTEAAEKLANAQEKTNQLAAQMEESVHATLADEMKKAAETMQQSRENMENAPLQDEAQQREEKIDQARNQAEESIRQLEKIKEEMQKQNEKIQDLARLQELAQRQRELARQAKQQAAPQEQEKQQTPPQEWQQQQQQVAQQMRQELEQQPQALAEALRQQAEQTRELAKEAEEMAKSQQQLEQQAKEAAENQNQLKPESQQALQEALASEQEKIAKETAEQLAEAREQRNELANDLPKAAESTKQASETMQAQPEAAAAAEAAASARDALKESAEKADAQAQQADATAQEAANPEKAQEEKSEAAQNAPQAAEKAQQAAAAADALADLAERQEQVAEAMQAMAQGDEAKALQALQQMQAQQAQELAQQIEALPQAQQASSMEQAAQSSKQAGQQAQQAAEQAQQGEQQQAAGEHQQAQQNFEKSAQALQQAAAEIAQAAEQAGKRENNPQKAQASPEAMAEAFQQASQAAESNDQQQAAQQAQQAAAAMQQAAQSAKSQMQGQQPGSGTPGQQPGGEPGEPGQQPGQQAQQGDAPAQADPGVPPELAKLGISAADWEKIQASLASDVGPGSSNSIPEEYRELVKGYFQSMSAKETSKP